MAFSTKHYFWLGNVILLGLVVWFGISFGMSILSHKLDDRIMAEHPVYVGQKSEPRMHSLSQYEGIARQNMFGGKEKPEKADSTKQPVDVKPAAPAPAPAAAPKVDMKLKGTIVDRQLPDLSVAILENPRNREQDIYRPGDKIGSVEVVRVDRESVTLREGGQEVKLIFEEGPSTPARAPRPNKKTAPEAPAQTSPEPSDKVVEVVGPNSYVISRETLAGQMDNLGAFMSQVRIAPYFKNGEAHGFRIAHVQPNSTVFQLGLRRGDVITEVNDVSVSNPQDLMNIYQQLQQLENVMLDIERRGQPVTIKYSLR